MGIRQIRRLVALAGLTAVGLLPGASAEALDSIDETTDSSNPGCDGSLLLRATLRLVGIPLTNSTVKLDATTAKFFDPCNDDLYTIPSVAWRFTVKPTGSLAILTNATTRTPSVRLDKVGTYTAEFTACPASCTITTPRGAQKTGPVRQTLTISAQATFTPTPSVTPLTPIEGAGQRPGDLTDAVRSSKCQADGIEKNAVSDPQWVTVNDFLGPQSYRDGEGKVLDSRIAPEDNPLNHGTHDHLWNMRMDPASENLLLPERFLLHNEWESQSIPERARPTVGDRASMTGLWILDCGHSPFNTEIHAPVAMAVQRPRPVAIPQSSQFSFIGRPPESAGSGVTVPGVVTEIVINRDPGDMASCGDSDTDLHQPAEGGGSRECIREPLPINRKYEFDIQLPKSPLTIAKELGFPGQPVPLYTLISRPARAFDTADLNNGDVGPEPVITEDKRGTSVTQSLRVSVDLTNFKGSDYSRRITAAWVYPDNMNWGLKKWKVSLQKIHVYNDLEPGGNDGDWKLFFNTTNVEKEWTKVLDCDGCVDDNTDRSLAFTTGGNLGPDLLLFPGQRIWVSVAGYDEDFGFSDDTGNAVAFIEPRVGPVVTRATPGGIFDLHWTIGDLGIVRSVLSPGAQALRDAFTFRGDQTGTALGGRVQLASFSQPNDEKEEREKEEREKEGEEEGEEELPPSPEPGPGEYVRPEPDGIDLAIDYPLTKPVDRASRRPTRESEVEERKWNTVPPGIFKKGVEQMQREEPAKLDALMRSIRARVDTMLNTPGMNTDVAQDLPVLKAHMPADLWEKYFKPFMKIRAAVLADSEEDSDDSTTVWPYAAAAAGAVVVIASVVVLRRRRAL